MAKTFGSKKSRNKFSIQNMHSTFSGRPNSQIFKWSNTFKTRISANYKSSKGIQIVFVIAFFQTLLYMYTTDTYYIGVLQSSLSKKKETSPKLCY